ncbi:MAG: response regulator [Chloroflexota bacterium]
MSGSRILIVEDNKYNMELLVDVLTSLDYEVFQATDGVLGVEMTSELRPELVLMDLSLPKKDGWTATREIKAQNELNQIPIIALTAHAMQGDKERALEAGCDDYISKPINLQELASKLDKYLGTNS